jgi:hypothetical protein
MKKVRFLLLAAFATILASCQKEVAEQELDNNKPTPTGDTRIIIEGEGMIGPVTRSSDGKVEFEGGYATGAGLYNKDAQPEVAAHPDAGYEVNYFYGGPENELHRYDYAQSGSSTFDVKLKGEDHTFRCHYVKDHFILSHKKIPPYVILCYIRRDIRFLYAPKLL